LKKRQLSIDALRFVLYLCGLIRSIKHKGLKRFFESGDRKGLPAPYIEKIYLVLAVLDSASDISLINLPGGRMHGLSGDRKGYWSLSISRNWRITFRFDGQDITDVDFEDYH